MYRDFRVPSDEDLEAALGVVPESGAEVGVRHLQFVSGDGCKVTATTDAVGRSLTLRVERDAHEWLRITREGATELVVSRTAPEIVVTFRTEDTAGRLEVHLRPRLRIHECTLFA